MRNDKYIASFLDWAICISFGISILAFLMSFFGAADGKWNYHILDRGLVLWHEHALDGIELGIILYAIYSALILFIKWITAWKPTPKFIPIISKLLLIILILTCIFLMYHAFIATQNSYLSLPETDNRRDIFVSDAVSTLPYVVMFFSTSATIILISFLVYVYKKNHPGKLSLISAIGPKTEQESGMHKSHNISATQHVADVTQESETDLQQIVQKQEHNESTGSIISTIAIIAVIVVGILFSITIIKGCSQYKNVNYINVDNKAVRLMLPEEKHEAAKQGNKFAQNDLGVMYRDGLNGFIKDERTAVKWFQKSAEQGNAEAQNNLGTMYYNGRGVPQSYTQAMQWRRKAAEQGNALAQDNLAGMYAHGLGVPQDDAQAVQWARKAAEQGNALAQEHLGFMYVYGRGVPQDYTQAVQWYRRAAEQGLAGAQYDLGVMYENGYGVPKDYTQAYAWYRKAAEQGNEDAKKALERLR